jgi:hypothetical protein
MTSEALPRPAEYAERRPVPPRWWQYLLARALRGRENLSHLIGI